MDEKAYIIPEYIWGSVTVAQEASSEPYLDKVMVAEVILRRTRDKKFSDGTVMSTVLWPYQFSGWNTTDPNRLRVARYELSNPKMAECIKAFKEAHERGTNYSNGATHYYARYMKKPPAWAKAMTKVAEGKTHIFFREG